MKKTMLRALVAALTLTLFTGSGALAAPVLGGVEKDLQQIFHEFTVGGDSSIDVTRDFIPDHADSYWSITASGSSVATMIIEVAGWKDYNIFGVYQGEQRVELFSGPDGAGDRADLTIDADGRVFVNFDDTGVVFSQGNHFGYYLTNKLDQTFFSDSSLNPYGVDHMFAYQGTGDSVELAGYTREWTPNQFILAWEDIQGGGDLDYQDMVLMVESVRPVPEPGTLLLLGSGLLGLAYLSRRSKA